MATITGTNGHNSTVAAANFSRCRDQHVCGCKHRFDTASVHLQWQLYFCIRKIWIVFRRNQPNSAPSRHLAHLQLQIRRVSKPQVCSVACASVGRRTNVRLCCPCRGDSAAAQRALGFATLKLILSLQDAHAQLQAQSCMQLQTCIAARNSCSCNSWFVATTVSDTDRSPRRRLITAASHILSPDVSQLKSFYSEIVRNSAKKKHVDLEKAFTSHHCD